MPKTYRGELEIAMAMLAQHPDTVFIGQAVGYPGTAMSDTLSLVPQSRKIELPVFEDTQMGMAIGMSLDGLIPICIYPRIQFMILALNQLVNHLDKLPIFGNGWHPKVIIRTAIPTSIPLDPGPQHLGDYSVPIFNMLKNVRYQRFTNEAEIGPGYERALEDDNSWLMVEDLAMYDPPSHDGLSKP